MAENVKTNWEFKHKQPRGVGDRNHGTAPAHMLWGATYFGGLFLRPGEVLGS